MLDLCKQVKHLGGLIPILFFFFFIFSFPVSGAGTCVLGKEIYHNGESQTFSCSCTLGNEKNVAGFISFVNGSDVLQNVSVNSNDCIGSTFGDTFSIPVGSGFVGNATFETADVNWADANDVVRDNFSIEAGGIYDCIITDILGSETILGELGAVEIAVKDSITLNPLSRASCIAAGYSAGNVPLLFEPYGAGNTERYTGADGVVGFQHLMAEKFWQPNTTYLYEFRCYCIPNSSDEECWDEVTGLDVGFRSCTAQKIFTTGAKDNRGVGVNVPRAQYYFMIVFLIFVLIVLGHWYADPVLAMFGGMVSAIFGVYIFMYAADFGNAFLINGLSVIFFGLGCYYIVVPWFYHNFGFGDDR